MQKALNLKHIGNTMISQLPNVPENEHFACVPFTTKFLHAFTTYTSLEQMQVTENLCTLHFHCLKFHFEFKLTETPYSLLELVTLAVPQGKSIKTLPIFA